MQRVQVSPAAVVEAMIRLSPSHTETILALMNESGGDLTTFCRSVRSRIGGSLLFDTVLLLQGGKATGGGSGPKQLFVHAVSCRTPSCPHPGCTQLRSMFTQLRQHSQHCSKPQCQMCTQHQKVRDATMRARAAFARPSPASAVVARPMAPQRRRDPSPCAGLMMLARSALGDLPVHSPRNSPANSPRNSPCQKRPKFVHTASPPPNQPMLVPPVSPATIVTGLLPIASSFVS